MDATLIRKLLTDLLTASVAALTDPPDRQFVAHGDHAHDCEMVATRLLTIRTESIEGARGMRGGPVIPIVSLRVLVLRCYPTVDGDGTPAADALTAASLTLADDAVDLSGGLLDRWEAGTLFPTAGIHADRVEVGLVEPVAPEGGLAGLRIDVDVRT